MRIGQKTAIELIHVAAGVAAALLIGKLSAWSYPLAEDDIWLVTCAAIVVTAILGVGPIRRALAEDQLAEAQGD